MSLADRLGGTDRVVVAQFHATWCGPCKSLSPRVAALEKEFEGKVEVVRIDVDQEPDLAQEAKVRGVPTLIAYRDGREIRRQVGSLDNEGLRTFFRSAEGEVAPDAPVAKTNWMLAAKFGAGLGLILVAGQFPSLDWLRWGGIGILLWGMRDFCPACRTSAGT